MSKEYILEGEVLSNKIEETKKGQEFKQVVIETTDNAEYPCPIALDFWGKKMEMSNELAVGDIVKAKVNIRSNAYNEKYYYSFPCWSVSVTEAKGVTPEIPADADTARTEASTASTDDDESGDLPF